MNVRQTSYLKKSLMKGEEAMVEGHLHWIRSINVWAITALGLVFVALAFIEPLCLSATPIFFIWAFIQWLKVNSVQQIITNKRVIAKDGIISIHTEEIRNAKVESIEIHQPILGRLLGYATIHFSGTGNSDVYFVDVADPWVVKNAAEAIINEDSDPLAR